MGSTRSTDRQPGGWRAVSFDLDGTLYDYDRCHCRALEATGLVAHGMLGVSQGHFTRLYRASRATVHRRLSGTAASHSRLLYFQELVRRHTGRPAPRNVRKLEANSGLAIVAKPATR